MIIQNPGEFRDNLVIKFNKIIKRKKISVTLEKAIYNWSIQDAKKKMIVRKWDNHPFVQIYLDRVHSIYLNINPKSYIANKKIVKDLKKAWSSGKLPIEDKEARVHKRNERKGKKIKHK